MSKLVHASIDERSKISGGSAGDQTGSEVCARSWYDKDWTHMLRYKDAAVAKKVAAAAVKLANSNLVGYDQDNRNSLYKQLKKNDWDVDKYIKSKVKTETDCSAFVYACYCIYVKSMRQDGNAPTTTTWPTFAKSNGFTVYTDSKYLSAYTYLKDGDLLDKKGHHIVMSWDNTETTSSTSGTKYKVSADTLNVRSGAGTSYSVVKTLKKGTTVTVTTTKDGFGKITSGWVSMKYLTKC